MDPMKTGIFSQDSAFLQHYQTANRRINTEQQGNASSVESKNMHETTKLLAQSAMKPSIKAEPMWYGGPQRPQSVQVIRGAHGSILSTRMSTGLTAGRASLVNPYIRKWRRLKRVIKDLVYVNAAVCDEVVCVEEKIAKVKEERRFLLRKLLHYQSLTEGSTPQPKVSTTTTATPVVSKAGTATSSENSEVSPSVKSKPKPKKKLAASTAAAIDKKKITVMPTAAKEILEAMQPKSKKSKAQVQRKVIPPLQLDSSGRPIFPLVIGDLTVHSIGEIVSERPGFHSAQCIYPEGFCSTRSYASTLDPTKPCLYTCKISDGGNGPVVPISERRAFIS